MNKPILSWATYDFANTIFSMNIVSRYFPIMAITLLGATDLAIGISRSAAMVLVAVTMPVLGAFADQFNNRRLPLIIFTVLCCGVTAVLGLSNSLIIELLLFALAVYCYQSSLTFYNALLTSVATPQKIGYVSGLGVAFGYAGSITGLFIVAFLSAKTMSPYIWTAILFLLFSLPAFFWVKDKGNDNKTAPASGGYYKKGLIVSLRRASAIEGMIRFLVGRFFVVEAMETVILFMAVYLVKAAGFKDTTSSGTGLDEVTFYLIIVTFFTVFGSYFWGILTNRFGPKKMLIWAVVMWLIALTGIVFSTGRFLFYIWGAIAGVGLGGVWTADRPLLINLVHDHRKLGEYFGLYALSGRLAAVVGPLIWGAIIYFTSSLGALSYKLAVEALFIMMVVGIIILYKVPDVRSST